MNEIKFRGKRKDNGEWVYGFYFKTPLTDEATKSKPEDGWYFLTGRERYCISKEGCAYEVIPETVSQFIGLKDCIRTKQYPEGQEIYKGDIVKVEDYVAIIEWDIETCRYVINIYGEHLIYDFDNFYSKELEKIGNIYENFELLKW